MTREEHLLVVGAMTKALQSVKVIVEVLKNREILKGDDSQAFAFAVQKDLESNSALFRDALREYLRIAKGLGVLTGLEETA